MRVGVGAALRLGRWRGLDVRGRGDCRTSGREDLVAEEETELAILQTYLPQQLTRDEIEAEARQVIDEVGASSPRDIGKVMKPLMARLKGRADGRLVNQVVRELLSG